MFRMYIVTQLPPFALARGGSSYNEIVCSQLSPVGAKSGVKTSPRGQSSRVASSNFCKSQSLCCSRVRDELSSTSASGA